jgi:MinD superfamily P-loop ATPase
MGEVLLVFPEMCHGCGGCIAVCPEGALSPGYRVLGEISWGKGGEADFIMGNLRVSEAMSPPLMKQVKKKAEEIFDPGQRDMVIDAPPGVSCPAMNAVMDSDGILLVTEPTPFGVYDLMLAHEAFTPMEKPMGVVVNRAGLGDDSVYAFCREKDLKILAEIPFDRRIAEAYSRGEILSETLPDIRDIFESLARDVFAMVNRLETEEV